MKNSYVYFINDNSSHLAAVYSAIEGLSAINSIFVDYKTFINDDTLGQIKKINYKYLIIVVEAQFYKTIETQLQEILKMIYNMTFNNIIKVFPDSKFLSLPEFASGKENGIAVYPGKEIELQASYFSLYIISLFDKIILSSRLTDYICNSFKEVVYSELLTLKNKEIDRLNKELERKNQIDNLTSIYNRSALFDFLEKERKRTIRDIWRIEKSKINAAQPENRELNSRISYTPSGEVFDHYGIFSIMMIDIDYFKRVNDQYGHLKGDEVIKALAALLHDQDILRQNDIAGRFGGEEFIIILPETNSHHAKLPAARLNQTFKAINFISDEGVKFNVTISIGISEFKSSDQSNEEIIHRADKALYYAKENGRDRVDIYEDVFPD